MTIKSPFCSKKSYLFIAKIFFTSKKIYGQQICGSYSHLIDENEVSNKKVHDDTLSLTQ